jgi:hypothetical protein
MKSWSFNLRTHRGIAPQQSDWWRKAKPTGISHPGLSAMMPASNREFADRARSQAAAGIDQRSNPYRDLPEEESPRSCGRTFAIRLKVAREGKTL